MEDASRTSQQLLEEISLLKKKIKRLERSQAECLRSAEALRRSEVLLKTCLENTPDGVYMADMEGNVLYSNRKSEEVTGCRNNELIGGSFWESNVLSEKRLSAATGIHQARTEGRSTTSDEIELVDKDGSLVSVEIETAVVQPLDQRIILGFLRDITGRKLAERKLKQQTDAMEASMDGIAILDRDKKHVYVNGAHARIYGYDGAEELIGRSWRTLYDENELERFNRDIMPEFSEKGQWRGEATGRKRDGRSFFQEVSLAAMDNGGLICIVREITEQKITKLMLEHERVFLRRVIDAVPSFVCVKSADGRFLLANRSLAEAYGTTVVNLEGKRDRDFNPRSNQVAPFRSDDIEVMRSKKVKTIPEEKVTYADETTHWLSTTRVPLVQPDGTCEDLLAVATDITDRKRAEAALQEESTRRRILFEQSPYGVLIVDPENTHFVDFNRAAHRQLGYSREEFAELGMFDVEAGQSAEEIRARIAEATRGRKADFETLQRTRQGEIRNVHVREQIVDIQGRPFYHCVWRDITEHKRIEEALRESEAQLRGITDSARDAIIMTDPRGAISYWNPAAAKMFGYSRDEAMGKNLRSLLVPECYLGEYDSVFEKSVATGSGSAIGKTLELAARRKDGREIPVDLSLSLVSLRGESYAVGILRDITDRKRAEEENRHSEKLSTALEMAGAICHELNQPLQVISGRVDLLSMGNQDDGTRKALEIISDQTLRMGAITRRLMGLKKYSSRDYVGAIKITDIDEASR